MGWKDFVNADNEELLRIRTYSPFELEAKIAILMDEVHQYELCLKVGSIIDCFFNLYMFANEHNLSGDELLLVLKLQSKLLENCEGDLCIDDNIKYFCDTLRTVEDTEDADEMKVFGQLETCKAVVDYILQTFFQHYKLYHHIFHHSQNEEVINHEISIDVFPTIQPYPPPLEESISEDLYNLYLNPTDENEEENVDTREEIVTEDVCVPSAEASSEADAEHKVESLLAMINQDDMKRLIKETAEKKLNVVKMELESKILEKEASLMKNLDKLKI